MRAGLVAAARQLIVERGWDVVRMADVAQAAGVSRQTVYNEFDSRAGLAEAVAVAEIDAFVGKVNDELFAYAADPRAALEAAIGHTLTEAARNPLVRAILGGGPGGSGELMPYLTTRSEIVLAAAGAVVREWAAVHLRDHSPADVELAADTVIRLTVSHLLLPAGPPADAAAVLAEVFLRLIGGQAAQDDRRGDHQGHRRQPG